MEKEQERNETEGHLFNVFALWNRLSGIGETLHSRLLHFLLSDDPMHGQKNKFLMKFLEMAGIEDPQEGTWYATAETGRVDVMLKCTNPHSVIIIENKSNWAGDQNNQLYRSGMKTCTPRNGRHMTIPITKSSIFHRVQIKNSTVRAAANRRKWFVQRGKQCDYDKLPCKIPLEPVVWHFNDHIHKVAGAMYRCLARDQPATAKLSESV